MSSGSNVGCGTFGALALIACAIALVLFYASGHSIPKHHPVPVKPSPSVSRSHR